MTTPTSALLPTVSRETNRDGEQTLRIRGRTRHSEEARTVVQISRHEFEDPFLVIEGAEIDQRANGVFTITARHHDATDVEHDSSHVAYLEGAGLIFDQIVGFASEVRFTGVILTAKFYTEEPVAEEFCDDERCTPHLGEHPFLDYTPPTQKWKPSNYFIKVKFNARPATSEDGEG